MAWVDAGIDTPVGGLHGLVWERALNALVYEVYGLTDEEIAIVEGQR
jgi:hypothetical protein